MTLRLDLFDLRFDQLIEDGRARIPNLAPDWTDHNLHDPGITLMELLAWTAEAQTFALSRLRRDERLAYAALLGLAPRGPAPARGQIWPDAPPQAGQLVAPDAAIGTGRPDSPRFWTGTPILLAPARIERVRTRQADGCGAVHGGANTLDGPGYQPFGPAAGPHDVLELGLRCTPGHHLLEGARPADLASARLALGVRVLKAPALRDPEAPPLGAPLLVTLVDGRRRVELPVVHDGSAGFLRNGVLLLGLGPLALPASAPIEECTLEISAPAGFARAPRIRCIGINVLPLVQSMAVTCEPHAGTGLPDQAHAFDQPGLQSGGGPAPVRVWSVGALSCERWELRRDLDASGPGDRHVMLDAGGGRLVFGNGVNGMAPAAGEQLLFSYRACLGAAGNLPRNQSWHVEGVGRGFGANPDSIGGGADRLGMDDLRRQARRVARERSVLVTAGDLVEAALALDDLEVARAALLAPRRDAPCTVAHGASYTLVVDHESSAGAAQRRRWLAAVRCRLAPRLPLGTRLRVIGARRVPLRLKVQLVAEPMHDPACIARDLREHLAQRIGANGLSFGAMLAPTTVAAWLSERTGVERVVACQLAAGAGEFSNQAVTAPPDGLLQFDPAGSQFVVERRGSKP